MGKERRNDRHTMKDKLEAEADASCYPPTLWLMVPLESRSLNPHKDRWGYNFQQFLKVLLTCSCHVEKKRKQNEIKHQYRASWHDLIGWTRDEKWRYWVSKCLKYGTLCNWRRGVWLSGRVIAQHISVKSLIPRKTRKGKPRENRRTARTIKDAKGIRLPKSSLPDNCTCLHFHDIPEDKREDMGEAFKEEDGSYSQRTLVGIH